MPDDPENPDDSAPLPSINWVQVAAGALAAVTSAVLLSTVGVAGTLLGAAVGSVAASVGSAVYGRTIELSHRRVAAQAAALRSLSKARDRLGGVDGPGDVHDPLVDAQLEDADHELDHAEQVLQDDATGIDADAASSSPIWRDLPWKRIGVLAAGLFLVVMSAITVFELVAGQSVSELTGGTSHGRTTTVPGLGDGSTEQTPSESPSPTDSPTGSPTETVPPTATPLSSGEATPTDEATSTPEPTATGEATSTDEATPDGVDATGDADQG